MSLHNPSEARKPSGSSNHSGVRSGTSSPSIAQPQRNLTPTAASNMLGVAMSGSSNAMKALNSGWQVWPSKRNASVSSAASISELASSQGLQARRGMIQALALSGRNTRISIR
ncbi:hypothetical protein BDN71DRAFT_942444 [Pleurotus eryngii]|uniref:Uncharacterized protein n=1 Tax=Pleurotus eryngii TaxID=5323 RepID=A0A9P6A9T0_PLEER|nr:hypothetical protein BDN71DRAFT_942444 [Pleurotus eryngii]